MSQQTAWYRRSARLLALGVVASLGVACAGTAATRTTTTTYGRGYTQTTETEYVFDYPVLYVERPPDLAYYPRVYYRGNYAYLVDGYWYYPRGSRWVVFRKEPIELYNVRVYRHDRLERPRGYVPSSEYGSPSPLRPRPRYYEGPKRPRYYEAPPRPRRAPERYAPIPPANQTPPLRYRR